MVNKICVKSRDIKPKKPGIVSISTKQSANIMAQSAAVRGLNGLQMRISIDNPVNVIVMVIIVVMPSKVKDLSTNKQKT